MCKRSYEVVVLISPSPGSMDSTERTERLKELEMIDVDAAYQGTLSTESEATRADWGAAVATGLTYNAERGKQTDDAEVYGNEGPFGELTDETPTDPADDTPSTFSEPADLRRRREELGVSRRAVQEATGLSSSVVWRSESEKANKIANDEWAKIDGLYAKWAKDGVPTAYAKPAKPAKVAAHSGADQIEASRQLAALYQEF